MKRFLLFALLLLLVCAPALAEKPIFYTVDAFIGLEAGQPVTAKHTLNLSTVSYYWDRPGGYVTFRMIDPGDDGDAGGIDPPVWIYAKGDFATIDGEIKALLQSSNGGGTVGPPPAAPASAKIQKVTEPPPLQFEPAKGH